MTMSVQAQTAADSGGAVLNDDMRRVHRQQNQLHTFALLGGIGALLTLPVMLIWGWTGLIFAIVLIATLYAAARGTPPELLMRAYQGTAVTQQNGAQLIKILTVLADRAELPARPTLYVIPSLTLNAFATGTRERAAIAVTEGLLRKLEMRELAAVLAHEVSHIKNNDLGVMAIADIASRLVQAMSYFALFLVLLNMMSLMIDGEPRISWLAIIILYLAPLLSSLMQLGLSRTREYDADLEAALLTGNPSWLVSALVRLERHTGAFWEDLMLPVPGRRVPQPSLLRSHPTTESRVARLKQLETASTLPPILIRDEPFVSAVDAGLISMRPRYRFPGIWF
ncbi:MAG: M48 family metalloprotease [Alphaproteobacteria bacterium]|nr:M48 family metalloprotease [Alphaproteobacteria bacterium]